MKYVLKLFLIACSGSSFVSAAQSSQERPLVILVDLGGVVVTSSYGSSYALKLGLGNLVSYLLRDKVSPFSLGSEIQKKVFYVLSRTECNVDPTVKLTRTTQGVELPYLLNLYQAGKISDTEAATAIQKAVAQIKKEGYFLSDREALIIEKAALLSCDPVSYAQTIKTLDEGVELIRDLATQKSQSGARKFKIYGLSNWDKLSFELVRKLFPELWNLFDAIYVSGDIGVTKPNRSAYEYVMRKHALDKSDIIFIDDQQENIDAAKECGIEKSFLYMNADQMRKELIPYGLPLKPQPTVSSGTLGAVSGFVLLASSAYFLSYFR